jgi:hypothetical protein
MSQLVRIPGLSRHVKRIDVVRDVNLKQATTNSILTMLKTHAFHGAFIHATAASGVSVVPTVRFISGGVPITGSIQLQALTAASFGVWVPPYAVAGVNQAVKLMLAGDLVSMETTIGATATTLTADVHLFGYPIVVL